MTVDEPIRLVGLEDSVAVLVGRFRDVKGVRGRGVPIVIVDTGFYRTNELGRPHHPMLLADDGSDSKVVAEKHFLVGPRDTDPNDGNGHGTGMGSIAAGRRMSLKFGGAQTEHRPEGVAPGAWLINAKGLSAQGSGSFQTLQRAMEWGASKATEYNPAHQVMSCSWGIPIGCVRASHYPPFHKVIADLLRKHPGLMICFAAGNCRFAGPGKSMSCLGDWDYERDGPDALVTVGAHAIKWPEPDRVASFSSVGPATYKPDLILPRVVAPGGNLKLKGEKLPGEPEAPVPDDERILTAWIPTSSGFYKGIRGTSISTPHVAGLLALAIEAYPERDRDWYLKRILQTGRPHPNYGPTPNNYVGVGSVNGERAFLEIVAPPPPPPPPPEQRYLDPGEYRLRRDSDYLFRTEA